MADYVKQNGTWVPANSIYGKIGGSWSPSSATYFKQDGVWKTGQELVGVDGCLYSYVDAATISIAGGTILGPQTSYTAPAMTKKPGLLFVEGSGQGGNIDGGPTANQSMSILAMRKADGTIDYGFTNSTNPTLPSGFVAAFYIGLIYWTSGVYGFTTSLVSGNTIKYAFNSYLLGDIVYGSRINNGSLQNRYSYTNWSRFAPEYLRDGFTVSSYNTHNCDQWNPGWAVTPCGTYLNSDIKDNSAWANVNSTAFKPVGTQVRLRVGYHSNLIDPYARAYWYLRSFNIKRGAL